jgi:hypothetical protein
MKNKTLYQMSMATLRYSQARDNHLAPYTAMENISEALNYMDNDFELSTIQQIIKEIEFDLKLHSREYAYVWLSFIEDLKKRIIYLDLQKEGKMTTQIDLCNPLHIMALSSLAIEGNQVAIKLLDLTPEI